MASNITFRVDETLKSEFIDAAKANGTTATALFHKWMREYLYGTNNSTNNTDNCSTNTTSTNTASTNNTDNSTNTASTNNTDNSTNNTTNWEGMIDDLISEKLEARLESIQNNQDYLIEKKLEDACQGAIAKMEEKMEGISCNLPAPKEDDTWEPLMSLNEVEAKYGKKSTGDIPPENESGAKNPYDSPERRIKELIKKDRSHWDTVATLTQQQQAREIEDFLIRNGFKPEGYSFSSSALSRWKNTLYPKAPNPESKTYLAYRTYMAAIYNRGRK